MTFLANGETEMQIDGDSGSSQHAMKVLLASAQQNSATNANGLATFSPSTGGVNRPMQIEIMATAGTGASLQYELPVLPALSPDSGASTGSPRPAVTVRHQAPNRRGVVTGIATTRRSADLSNDSPLPFWGISNGVPDTHCLHEKKSTVAANQTDGTRLRKRETDNCEQADAPPSDSVPSLGTLGSNDSVRPSDAPRSPAQDSTSVEP
jgi:hypothetical protein